MVGRLVQAVTGSSSGLKISLAELDDADGVCGDPGADPAELEPDPEATPEVSELAGERFGDDLASEDLTDHEVEYCAAALAAAASLLILLLAFLSSMIFRNCSILLLVIFCSSSGVAGCWNPEKSEAEGSKPGLKMRAFGSEQSIGVAPTPENGKNNNLRHLIMINKEAILPNVTTYNYQ